MSTLGISGGPEANGAEGSLPHVVRVVLMGLSVGAKRDAGVMGVSQLATGEQVAWRVLCRDSISCRERIEPENGVLDQVDEHEARNAREWKHAVGASRAILDGPNVTFDVRDVFICSACLELRKHWTERFKFIITEDGGDPKTPMMVHPDDR